MRRIHISTCVWGPWHLDMLSRVTWPTVLADGNLPALARQFPLQQRICTTKRDQALIRAMPIFEALQALAPVVFIDTPSEEPTVEFHMGRFVTATEEARQDGAIFLNLWPDVLYSDGTLGHAGTAIADGFAGCIIPSFRVISETCVAEAVDGRAPGTTEPMAIAPGDLVRMGARHMHPLSATGFAGASTGRPDTGLVYRVPGEGFVSRTSLNVLYFDPSVFEIHAEGALITSRSDARLRVIDDSDDMFFLSLAPLSKELETFRPNHANDAVDIARLTLLPHVRISPLIEAADAVRTRLHYGAMTEAAWAPVVARSDRDFRSVSVSRLLIRLAEVFAGEGCGRAASLLAMALLEDGNVPFRPAGRPLTVFVPNDASFHEAAGHLERLLAGRRHRAFRRAMLSHVVESGSRTPEELLAALGEGTDPARILSRTSCGPHRVCVIDRVLHSGPAAKEAA